MTCIGRVSAPRHRNPVDLQQAQFTQPGQDHYDLPMQCRHPPVSRSGSPKAGGKSRRRPGPSRSTGPPADLFRGVLPASELPADRPKWTLAASELPAGAELDAIHDDGIALISNRTRFRPLECSPFGLGSDRGRWNCAHFKRDAIQAAEIASSLGPAPPRGRRALFRACRNGTEPEVPEAPEVFSGCSQFTMSLKACRYGTFWPKSEVPEVAEVPLPYAQITLSTEKDLICA